MKYVRYVTNSDIALTYLVTDGIHSDIHLVLRYPLRRDENCSKICWEISLTNVYFACFLYLFKFRSIEVLVLGLDILAKILK